VIPPDHPTTLAAGVSFTRLAGDRSVPATAGSRANVRELQPAR